MPDLSAIVMAAGKGTRMKSPLPKVLHPVAGKPLISYVIRALKALEAKEIRAVVGYGEKLLRQVVEPMGVACCFQGEQKGTGHAVQCADPATIPSENVLICNGDHPLIGARALKKAYKEFLESKAEIGVVSATLADPGHFGRIVRNQGLLQAIVEVKDASASTLQIKEVNTGIYFVKREALVSYLDRITPDNNQGEYYLTDLISIGIADGARVIAIEGEASLSFGVNTQRELALATKALFREKAFQLMDQGVVLMDPENVYIEAEVEVGEGAMIYPGCVMKGDTKIGPFSVIEPNVFINDCQIGQSVQIRAGSYLESATIGDSAQLGPYARIRPQTVIGEEAKVGNFVEMKKVNFGKGAKAGHLTYLGDADIGENTNIGCGTITCNYAADRKKYKTVIGKDVFVGSDTQFVAPVSVGDGAIVASGSTITKDIPAEALGIARGRQENKEGMARRFKGQSKDS